MQAWKVVASVSLLALTGLIVAGTEAAPNSGSKPQPWSRGLRSHKNSQDNHGWARQKLALEAKLQCLRLDWHKDADSLRAEMQLNNTVVPPTTSGRLYLSIVVTTNNANQAGQHTRLSFLVKNVFDFANKYNMGNEVEMVIVDYNSNPEAPGLLHQPSFVLPPKNDSNPLLRVIAVSGGLHKMITNKMGSVTFPSYWEFIAKNVGIRRACGEYIFVTTSDALPNEGFWQFIGGHHLRPDVLYRTVRINTAALPIEQMTKSSESGLSLLINGQIVNTCGPDPLVSVAPEVPWNKIPFWEVFNTTQMKTWLNKPFDSNATVNYGRRPLIGCPGDFIIAPRFAWRGIRGHVEIPIPATADDWAVIQLTALGLDNHMLPAPALIYHQAHHKTYSSTIEAAWQGIEGLQKWGDALTHNMLSKLKVSVVNDEHWGIGNHNLHEVYV